MSDFFDITQFPQEEGILLLGVSMNRIGNRQSPENTFRDLSHIDTKIRKTEGIGLVTLYSDYLYFHSDEPASALRDRYKELMVAHKNGFLNLLSKDSAWVKKAFSFLTFGQLLLDNADVFPAALETILKLYDSDASFREAVHFDASHSGHGLSEKERMFIFEEIAIFYLAAKGKLRFNNQFVQGTEKWVLQMYPGKPLKSEFFLFQKNPLNLSNPGNRFENAYYDLSSRILYDYAKIDIDTFDFSENAF